MTIDDFRSLLIAECSFTIMGKGADAITIGDVRGIADRLVAAVQSEGFIYPTMMVAHGEGYASTLHRFGEPCALCRPPIEITDEMVERARKASFDGFRSALIVPLLRAALEAALNG